MISYSQNLRLLQFQLVMYCSRHKLAGVGCTPLSQYCPPLFEAPGSVCNNSRCCVYLLFVRTTLWEKENGNLICIAILPVVRFKKLRKKKVSCAKAGLYNLIKKKKTLRPETPVQPLIQHRQMKEGEKNIHMLQVIYQSCLLQLLVRLIFPVGRKHDSACLCWYLLLASLFSLPCEPCDRSFSFSSGAVVSQLITSEKTKQCGCVYVLKITGISRS